MNKSQSLKPGLWSTTAEKIQTMWCAGGKRGEWLFFYVLLSIFCHTAMHVFCFLKKCKTINGSNYSDFQWRASPRSCLWIFTLSIVFIQDQAKWNSTSSATRSKLFSWGNLNEYFFSIMLPFPFIFKIWKLIRSSEYTLEDTMNLKNCIVSWDLNSTYLSKVAFWKYKSRKPSHHGITTNKTTSTALFVNSNLLYNKS